MIVMISALAWLVAAPVHAESEIEISIPAGDHVLHGTLTLPLGDGPFPGAVLISGSGPSDRDESLPNVALRPFAVLARELAEAGIATLRYDDRGVGASTGDFLAATSFDFADDANAVLAVLASQPVINPARVGFLGHSEGGMIAAHAAALNRQAHFVVTLAGTAVRGYDLFAAQLREALSGLPERDREMAFAAKMHELDLVVAEDWVAIRTMLESQESTSSERVEQGLLYYQGWLHTS